MIDFLERIIRVPFVSSILRIMHPNCGTCGCCGLPWALAEGHNIDMVECTDEHCGEGFFPVCEWCWQHKSFNEITNAVVSLYEFWCIDGLKHGYKPSYPLSEMLAKTRSEYERKKPTMTQDEKSIFLKDLCARVPYHPKGHVVNACNGAECDEWLTCATFTMFTNVVNNCRLYLRPISSMTEEEKEELKEISRNYLDEWENAKTPIERLKLDAKVSYKRAVFYNSHHIDWNDLTSKGLAIEVTEENNPYKE